MQNTPQALPQPTALRRLVQTAGRRIGIGLGLIQPPATPPRGQRRSYAAAQVNRLTEGWMTTSLSANADIHASLDNLRARSRQLMRDDPYARKFGGLVSTNVVGAAGFALQARVYDGANAPDTAANTAIEASWARWSGRTVCDVTGRQSLRDIMRAAVLAAARDGEVLIRLIRGSAAGNAYGLALQLLDVDRIDTALNLPAQAGHGTIRMGVECNAYGRPVALWLKNRHPGDVYSLAAETAGALHLRLPAEDYVHAFVADRPEQLRGVPWMHASMLPLNNLHGYQEAAIVASRVGASKMGFFTSEDGNVETLADSKDDTTGELYTEADAGSFGTLPPGTGFVPFDPDYPSAMFEQFVKANLRGIASGMGVAYHALANDLEGVSFSSIRSGTLEERDQWMMLQEWFIESVMEPIYAEWIGSALAFGQITLFNGAPLPLAKKEKFSAHLFSGRRWEWVDPLRDIQADIAAVDAGLQSPQRVASKLGRDYEDLLVEIKAAADMRQRIGVPAPVSQQQNGNNQQIQP